MTRKRRKEKKSRRYHSKYIVGEHQVKDSLASKQAGRRADRHPGSRVGEFGRSFDVLCWGRLTAVGARQPDQQHLELGQENHGYDIAGEEHEELPKYIRSTVT